jgi:hypothetical protein
MQRILHLRVRSIARFSEARNSRNTDYAAVYTEIPKTETRKNFFLPDNNVKDCVGL